MIKQGRVDSIRINLKTRRVGFFFMETSYRGSEFRPSNELWSFDGLDYKHLFAINHLLKILFHRRCCFNSQIEQHFIFVNALTIPYMPLLEENRS